jgi:hypothetical protein
VVKGLVIVAVLLSAVPARAEPTAGDILRFYDSKEPRVRETAEVAIHNLYSGVSWSNAAIKARGDRGLYCAPDAITLQVDQLADILRRGVRADASLAETAAGLAMVETLGKAFPCKR